MADAAGGEGAEGAGEGEQQTQQKDTGADFRRLHNFPLIRVGVYARAHRTC